MSSDHDHGVPSKFDLAAANWGGSIPVHLTLAPTSLSSPTLPPPIHMLVSRNTYLHTGLQRAVQRLHPFAPASPFAPGSLMFHVSEPDPGGGGGEGASENDNENDSSVCKDGATKSEDNGSNNDGPSDTINQHEQEQPPNSLHQKPVVYPVCWFEDEDTNMAVRWHLFAGVLFDLKASQKLPWRLKLHFTNYPATQILPLDTDVLTTVQASFKHSLKQALTLQQGNSKGAMNVSKESHGLLWDAVVNANIQIYRRVDLKLSKSPVTIPVRLLVNSTDPPIQRCISGRDSETTTLDDLLNKWVSDRSISCCRVCGVEPPLTTPLLELWYHCAHPDQFLYIVLLTDV